MLENERKIGALLSYVQVALSVFVNIIYVPVLLYFLGQSEYGLYQIVGSVFSYITVFESCMSSGVLRNYCNALGKRDAQLAGETLSTARSIYRLISLGMTGLGVVVIAVFRAFYADSFTIAELQESSVILGMLFCNMVVTLLGAVYLTVITGQEQFVFLKLSGILFQLIQPLLVIICVMKVPYAMSVTAVISILNILNVLLRRWYVRFRLRIQIPAGKRNSAITKEILILSSAILIGCIADQVFWKTDQVILGKMFSTAVVAVYSVGAQIYMIYMQFGTQVAGIFYPRISTLYQEENGMQKVSDLFIRVGRITFFIILLVLSGFIIFGKEFLLLWVGEGYQAAYWVAVIVMLPFSIDMAQNLGLGILQIKGQYSFRAKVYLLSALLNIITTVCFTRWIGIIGAALSTGISMFLTSGLIMNWYFQRRAGLDIRKFWKRTVGIIGVAGLLTVAILLLKNNIWRSTVSVLQLGAGILLYTILYGVVMFLWVADKSEKELVMQLFKRNNPGKGKQK